jgi:redox-sensitive bicupin YhaK (pirin superfamily)
MTAGDGIAHAEQTPPQNTRRLSGVQLWVALPAASRAIRCPQSGTLCDAESGQLIPQCPRGRVNGARFCIPSNHGRGSDAHIRLAIEPLPRITCGKSELNRAREQA